MVATLKICVLAALAVVALPGSDAWLSAAANGESAGSADLAPVSTRRLRQMMDGGGDGGRTRRERSDEPRERSGQRGERRPRGSAASTDSTTDSTEDDSAPGPADNTPTEPVGTVEAEMNPTIGTGNDDDVAVASAAFGADVPLTYFGPAPSMVERELIGPFQLLKSGVVDQDEGSVTIPIYKGIIDPAEGEDGDGDVVYYVVTDTSDKFLADASGINHSAKLRFGNVGRGARQAYVATDQIVHFANGQVDFSPVQSVTPGEDANFPPSDAQPGSVGDENYSPLFTLSNAGGEVFNGPIVSSGATIEQLRMYCDGIAEEDEEEARTMIHDKIIRICPDEGGLGGTVTLRLSPGHSFARPVLYLSMDASNSVAAALEAVTEAPGLTDVRVGTDDTIFSAVERIFITTNGHTNADRNSANRTDGPGEVVHPSRQGLNSAIDGEGSPLNTLGGIPTIATDYSPLWDANLGEWTPYAVANNYIDRLVEEFQILGFAERGFLTGPGGVPYGSSGFIVNCPIVFRAL